MMMYRFVTDHRAGKWYSDLRLAQTQANAIGAGYLEARTGTFYQYPGTRLETQYVYDNGQPSQASQEIAA